MRNRHPFIHRFVGWSPWAFGGLLVAVAVTQAIIVALLPSPWDIAWGITGVVLLVAAQI